MPRSICNESLVPIDFFVFEYLVRSIVQLLVTSGGLSERHGPTLRPDLGC